MKKNDWFLVLSALAFAILFYKQSPGVNFLLFSLLAGSLAILFNRETLTKKWYFYFGLHLLMAWNVFYINSDLSILAWVFSFFWLIAQSVHMGNSSLLSLFSSGLSPIYGFSVLIKKSKSRSELSERRKKLVYLAASGASLVLVMLFLALYKGANPIFDKFTDAIDLSWISVPFLVTMIAGFILSVSLAYPFRNEYMMSWDKNKLENTIPGTETDSGLGVFARTAGILIFGGLNIMLLLLNVLDVNYIFISKALPEGINLSDFVHDSVAAIVFSILLAISIILLTRNFTSGSKIYRILVYAWIAQSFVMLFDTFIRNSWYISEYQMTYLRIGVFVFLSLSVLGLIFTVYILKQNRNYWLLFDLNLKGWYIVICLTAFMNWNGIVTSYNLSKSTPDKVDLDYLFSLTDSNTPHLLEYYHKYPESFDSVQMAQLIERKKRISTYVKTAGWQSYSLAIHLQYLRIKRGK